MSAAKKKIITVILVLVLIGAMVITYIFTDSFKDTSTTKADFTVSAIPFIKEFAKNDTLANLKYAEKIITVNGRISEIEPADTILNIKMVDSTTGSYVIFAFQQQDVAAAKKLKEGDSVSVKGSCSGGAYSEILESHFITFKRSSLNK